MTTAPAQPIELEAIERLTKDIRAAARVLTPREARYIVDLYYTWQHNRIRAGNQIRAAEESAEPHQVIDWVCGQSERLEARVKSVLHEFAKADRIGVWSMANKGIGPVLSAGLLAHIDPVKATHIGHLWSFAGLAATGKAWGKGEKRPWNAALKTLCWKIGESFVKVSGHDDAFYGKLYVQFKAEELERNDRGEFAQQAADKLATTNIGKTTEAYAHYAAGRLPPAHLHSRAKRKAVKIFLAHWLDVAHRVRFGRPAPAPYAIAILGHGDWIQAPHLELIESRSP